MEKPQHWSFFRSRLLLTLLPLAILTLGVLWHVSRHGAEKDVEKETAAPAPAKSPVMRTTSTDARLKAAENIHALDIRGPRKFRRQIAGALSLIRQADEETYLFIHKFLYVIRNENRTGFYIEEGKPVAAVSCVHAFRSLPWCAGIIAHQAYHSYAKFTSGKKRDFFPPPPGSSKNLRVAANPMIIKAASLSYVLELENRASEFQEKVLIETGASRAEIRRVRDRARRDFSTAHDGDYALNP